MTQEELPAGPAPDASVAPDQDHLWDVDQDRRQAVAEVLTSDQNLGPVIDSLNTSMRAAVERHAVDQYYPVGDDTDVLKLVRIRDELRAIAPETAEQLHFEKADSGIKYSFGDRTAADILAEKEAAAQAAQ